MKQTGNRWQMMIVLETDHAGLKPSFQRLEDQLRHALAGVEDPRMVREHLSFLVARSREWMTRYKVTHPGK
jgi:hypothetical protein